MGTSVDHGKLFVIASDLWDLHLFVTDISSSSGYRRLRNRPNLDECMVLGKATLADTVGSIFLVTQRRRNSSSGQEQFSQAVHPR